LVALACLILAGMGTYEFLRPFIFRNVISWKADHIVTIFLGTSITIAIAYTYLAKHRESEERYRIAIENSNDGVVIVCNDGYLYVNQRFLDMFGYNVREEVMGKPLTINVHPDDWGLVSTTYNKRQNGEAVPMKYEFKGIKRNGE